jgi:peptide/nickel transport system permease protein
MLTYLAKRLLLMIPTLLGITIVVFVIIRCAPGDPLRLDIRGPDGSVDTRYTEDKNLMEMRARQYGLDQPWPVQYVQWLSHIVRLDLGNSITEKRPVIDMIGDRIGLTLMLNLLAVCLGYLISIPLGLIAARNRLLGGARRFVFDTLSGVWLLVLYSLPVIFVGTMAIALFSKGGVAAEWIEANHPAWSWLVMPIGGASSSQADQLGTWAWFVDRFRHLILPVAAMTGGSLAFMSKLSRTSLLENLQQDYVRTARAKGLKERSVVYVHALRNSMIPMITTMALVLPALIGGSVIIETIFNLPGMGKLFYDAVMRRDYEMIQAISLIGATLTLVALLLADVLYAAVDPRVRYD